MAEQVRIPTYGVGIMKGPGGRHYLTLDVYTDFTEHHFYLGDASNYESNAEILQKGILEAGKEAARLDSGLVVMNGDGGDLDAIVRSQRRQPGASRRSRSQGS